MKVSILWTPIEHIEALCWKAEQMQGASKHGMAEALWRAAEALWRALGLPKG